MWLNKADKVKESGGPTLDSLVNVLNMTEENFAAEKLKTFSKRIFVRVNLAVRGRIARVTVVCSLSVCVCVCDKRL